MKKIPLTQGKFAIVDDADYERLSKWKWRADFKGYAVRERRLRDGVGGRTIRMHREIMEPAEGLQVEHINGDKADNRRENLRVCTRAENARNRRKNVNNTTGFKGVRRHSRQNGPRLWVAQVDLVYLGCYATAEEAARAYDEAALKLHGEFAQLNFPTT